MYEITLPAKISSSIYQIISEINNIHESDEYVDIALNSIIYFTDSIIDALKDGDGGIERLEISRAAMSATIREMTKQIKSVIDDKNFTIADLKDTINELKSDLQNKEYDMNSLDEKVTSLEYDVQEKERELEESTETINNLNDALERANQTIHELNSEKLPF
ncbi:hypothetical protein [Microcystis phage Mel-JY01]